MKPTKPTLAELLFYPAFTTMFFGVLYYRGAETLIDTRLLVTFTLALGAAFASARIFGNRFVENHAIPASDQQS